MTTITISSPPDSRVRDGLRTMYTCVAGTSSTITNTSNMRSGHQGASPTLVAAAVSGGTSSMETPEEAAERKARAAARSRLYRERHPERVAAQTRAYREAHPRDRDVEKARALAYRAAHRAELREKDAAYRERAGDAIRARQRAWYEANKDQVRARQKAYQEANAERLAERKRINQPHDRAKAHGLTRKTVEALYALQNGRCAICGTAGALDGPMGLRIDHDHETGERRGLLCHLCNVALPAVERVGPTWADDAARYLANPPLRNLR